MTVQILPRKPQPLQADWETMNTLGTRWLVVTAALILAGLGGCVAGQRDRAPPEEGTPPGPAQISAPTSSPVTRPWTPVPCDPGNVTRIGPALQHVLPLSGSLEQSLRAVAQAVDNPVVARYGAAEAGTWYGTLRSGGSGYAELGDRGELFVGVDTPGWPEGNVSSEAALRSFVQNTLGMPEGSVRIGNDPVGTYAAVAWQIIAGEELETERLTLFRGYGPSSLAIVAPYNNPPSPLVSKEGAAQVAKDFLMCLRTMPGGPHASAANGWVPGARLAAYNGTLARHVTFVVRSNCGDYELSAFVDAVTGAALGWSEFRMCDG